MKVNDNRPISLQEIINSEQEIINSEVVRVEYLDDNHCRVILYSGYSIYIDRVEFERIKMVMNPEREEKNV